MVFKDCICYFQKNFIPSGVMKSPRNRGGSDPLFCGGRSKIATSDMRVPQRENFSKLAIPVSQMEGTRFYCRKSPCWGASLHVKSPS